MQDATCFRARTGTTRTCGWLLTQTGSSSSSLSGQGAPGRAASLEYGAGQESAAAAHPSADSPYASRLAPL